MIHYLRDLDYNSSITPENLSTLIGGDYSLRYQKELAAIEEISGYLIQRYDTAREFQPLLNYDNAKAYKSGNRISLTATAYNNGTTYTAGQRVSYKDGAITYIYSSIAGSTGTLPTVGASWTRICISEEIFYITYPSLPYDHARAYLKDEKAVFFDYEFKARYDLAQGIAPRLPDGSVSPSWVLIGAAATTTGVFVTDATKWAQADNRSAQMVMIAVDITLYHIHARINPRNIPELRIQRYDDAKVQLSSFASGKLTAMVPQKLILAELPGNPIQWGSNTKNRNIY